MENLNFANSPNLINSSPEKTLNNENNPNNPTNNKRKLRIAVVGCLHGNLKDTYDSIKSNEIQTGEKVDLLLCCGDFQCIRNTQDLKFKSCPDKYKQLGQFHHYYLTGTSAPTLTIFIGGNHEASNVLDQNFYSGWICENIFYLGRAGVITHKGIRIAGLSGIFKKPDYHKGHYEIDIEKDIKSIFHVREFEVAKLSCIKSQIDIFMTHDWPTGVVSRQDINKITKHKYHWKDELNTDTLGSPASGFLLKLLKPNLFLSGHMHYTYFNDIYHQDGSVTHFIALDKAGTKGHSRYFLHIFDYNIDEKVPEEDFRDEEIYLDPEWVHITRIFNKYTPLKRSCFDFSKFVENSSREEYLRCMARYEEIFNRRNNFTQGNSWKMIEQIPDKEFYEKINFYDFLYNQNILLEEKERVNVVNKAEEGNADTKNYENSENSIHFRNFKNFKNLQKKYVIKYDESNLGNQRESIVKMLGIEDYLSKKNKILAQNDFRHVDKKNNFEEIKITNKARDETNCILSEKTHEIIQNIHSNNEEINIDLDFI